MTHTMTHALANELKQAGFPQPGPKQVKFGQIWYDDNGEVSIILDFNDGKDIWPTDDGGVFQLVWMALPGEGGSILETNNEEMKGMVFAPTLDDITPHLPPTFALEIWDGKPSCTIRDDENPIRTFGDTFAEAAGRMWLEIKKQEI